MLCAASAPLACSVAVSIDDRPAQLRRLRAAVRCRVELRRGRVRARLSERADQLRRRLPSRRRRQPLRRGAPPRGAAGELCSAGACGASDARPPMRPVPAVRGRARASARTPIDDPANCGGCGTGQLAAAGQVCAAAGTCVDTCTGASNAVCNGGCVDTDTDNANCGGCNSRVRPARSASNGVCGATCAGARTDLCARPVGATPRLLRGHRQQSRELRHVRGALRARTGGAGVCQRHVRGGQLHRRPHGLQWRPERNG